MDQKYEIYIEEIDRRISERTEDHHERDKKLHLVENVAQTGRKYENLDNFEFLSRGHRSLQKKLIILGKYGLVVKVKFTNNDISRKAFTNKYSFYEFDLFKAYNLK